MRAAKDLVAEIDAEAETRGVACRSVADEVIELGLKALRAKAQRDANRSAQEERLAAASGEDVPAPAPTSNRPTQEALMAI